jgi:transcriptional regulator with PAS, ATPase and Fis domain
MKKQDWFKVFPGAITITNEKGTILEMNDTAAELFKKDGGYELIGQSAITCHKASIQAKVRQIYDTQSLNTYSITKNGKKQLVYQAPYFINGNFAGIVELALDLPDEIHLFNSDKY